MIGESSGVTTLINSDRIYRQNQVGSESKAADPGEEAMENNFSDVTSFSSEALALARNIIPVTGSAEEGQVEQQGRGQEKSKGVPSGILDIRV